jgi:coenzyme PQQ precursor peptide PqqA
MRERSLKQALRDFGAAITLAELKPSTTEEITTMEWTSPKFEEICLNCEINCYANAEL